jgi:hypothetical protein
MPNGVKYSTSIITGALLKGNVALAISGNLGPTSTTGLYSDVPPISGKYIINKVSVSGIPNFFAPANDAELVLLAKQEGATGANTGSTAAILQWIGTQPNLEAINISYPSIVTDGLVVCWDVGFTPSYPGSGTTLYDISGNGNNGTLVNGVGYSASNGGVLTFDGVDDWLYSATPNLSASSHTVMGASRYVVGANHQRMISTPINLTLKNWLMGNWAATTTNYYSEGWISAVGSGPDDTNWRIYSVIGNPPGDSYALYVNNSLSAGPNGGGSSGPIGFAVGGYGVGLEASNGEFSFLLAYNRVLTPDEMTQNYNAYRARFGL